MRIAIGLIMLLAPSLMAADARNPDGSFTYTNSLIKEKSPYLLQHAHNPVDWHPWGDEAFELARKKNRPIFLSVGYSTCHWCHVMEQESFSDAAIAKVINEHFVAIKVDREERPDVDGIYMTFLQATRGSGGWPMTIFLTPDRKPFFAATYIPPEDKDDSVGLKTVLARVNEAWDKQHDKLVAFSDQVSKDLARSSEATTRPGQLTAPVLAEAQQKFASAFDAKFGGFGDSTKFPQAPDLEFLIVRSARTGDKATLAMVLQTLRAMHDGGIHDHLAGGFHRYSTDRHWFLPHFEKMLYDQAQLLSLYTDAWRQTHDDYLADTARDIADYVLRDMTGPSGQFYSAEDADSATDPAHPEERREGAFYVWDAGDIGALLGADADVFYYHFGVEAKGNVEHDPRGELAGKNVLSQVHTLEETAQHFNTTPAEARTILAECRAKLFQSRSKRLRPRRDEKAICGWNGLMIGALAKAGVALNEPRYVEAARRAAKFAHEQLYQHAQHRLRRAELNGVNKTDGFLEDYAFLIQGLLDLYTATGDVGSLKFAVELQKAQDDQFWDDKSGGYFQTGAADASLLLRPKDQHDNAEPAGNSIACLNLLRLSRLLDNAAMRDRASRTLGAYSEGLLRYPMAWGAMLRALEMQIDSPRQIIIAGPSDGADTRALSAEIWRRYLPSHIIAWADGGAGQAFLAGHVAVMKDFHPIDGKPAAHVCENFTCQLPTTEPAKLGAQLDVSHNPPKAP